MSMGAVSGEKFTPDRIIANAVMALEGREDSGYSKGIRAYDAWKKALEEEKNFAAGENYSRMFEKMLCQIDAMSCLIDGRRCAASFFNDLADVSSVHQADYMMIAKAFDKCVREIEQMRELYGDMSYMMMLQNLADIEIRKQSCQLIERAQRADLEALTIMKKVISE